MSSETTRRQFLGGLAALGAGAALGGESVAASQARGQGRANQAAAATPGGPMDGMRIDTHHHFTPPSWLKAMADAGLLKESNRDGWSPQLAIEAMDRSGTRTAMISTGQFIWRLGPQGRANIMLKLSREANEFGTKMAHDYPGRFGLLAQLPLPNVDATLKEIEYAFDTLKADGIGITTSYNEQYIGDPIFAPVLQELNRRRAVVYSHPAPVVIGKHDFPREEETTRNIYSVLNDAALKYPNITWMFSHAGGTMPMIIQRIVGRETAAKLDQPAPPNSKLALIRKFYYDTAAAYNSAAMGALKKVVTPQQILFGTDMLGANPDAMKFVAADLNKVDVFSDQERAMIYRTNALKIFPRFAKT